MHGWGGSIHKLEPLKKDLEKKGWHVFSLELPFFDAPEKERPWDISDFSEYVHNACCSHFGKEKYFLLGHSNGGRITIKIASDVKFSKNLQGIILCSSAGISRDSILKRVPLMLASKTFRLFQVFPFYASLRKLPYILAKNYDYYQITSEVKKETFKKLIAENLKDAAKTISIPVLILWGKNDSLTPVKDAYWLRNYIKNSTLEVFPNQKHSIPYTIPDKLAETINQWEQSL